jgi:hypothetical protein
LGAADEIKNKMKSVNALKNILISRSLKKITNDLINH